MYLAGDAFYVDFRGVNINCYREFILVERSLRNEPIRPNLFFVCVSTCWTRNCGHYKGVILSNTIVRYRANLCHRTWCDRCRCFRGRVTCAPVVALYFCQIDVIDVQILVILTRNRRAYGRKFIFVFFGQHRRSRFIGQRERKFSVINLQTRFITM